MIFRPKNKKRKWHSKCSKKAFKAIFQIFAHKNIRRNDYSIVLWNQHKYFASHSFVGIIDTLLIKSTRIIDHNEWTFIKNKKHIHKTFEIWKTIIVKIIERRYPQWVQFDYNTFCTDQKARKKLRSPIFNSIMLQTLKMTSTHFQKCKLHCRLNINQ